MLTEEEKVYFNAVRPLVKMEIALVRGLVRNPGSLKKPEAATLRYALNLGQLGPFRTPSGEDIDLFDELRKFRETAIELLSPAINTEGDSIDQVALVRLIPRLQEEIIIARHLLLENHGEEFSESYLDREIGQKTLVSVGGGGGGSGLVYVGAYKLLEDHGIRPRYVLGSSIGSIVGMFRSISADFDAAKLAEHGRRINFGLRDIFMFKPPSAKHSFGLPAAIRVDLYPTAEKFFRSMGREVPAFEDLDIHYEPIVCGIKKGGLRHDPDYYAANAPASNGKGRLKLRVSTLKWALKTVNSFARELTNPEMLAEVVFGRDSLTRGLKIIDGVGFSCAIPGLLHYDIFRHDPDTVSRLSELMERDGLHFLVDGGLVNNVPSRIAWEGVYRGVIGTRNAFILAFDCFSPHLNRNILFQPVQRFLSLNSRKNLKYSHFTKTFENVPNPFHLISLPKSMLKMFKRGITELTPDLPFIHKMLDFVPGPTLAYGAK